MGYTPPIKGKTIKKALKPTPSPYQDFGSVSNLLFELRALREDIISVTDRELEKIDVKISEIDEKLKTAFDIAKGEDGVDADEQKIADWVLSQIRQPEDGKDANPEEIIQEVLQRLPKQPNEREIISKVLKLIPENKPSLKVIQESIDKEALIEELLKSPKFKLDIGKIDGLKTTLDVLDRRYIHGGGDTVGAGTNITITTVNGTKIISSSGGSSTFYSDTLSGTIDGANKVFTVANTISTAVALYIANSVYQPSVDFTVTGAKQITMTTAPDSSLSGQPAWLSHT